MTAAFGAIVVPHPVDPSGGLAIKRPTMAFDIELFSDEDTDDLIALSMRAWGPVFPKMEKAVPPYVYQNFYPQGWEARQTADIKAMLSDGEAQVWVAKEEGALLGYVGLRKHPEDKMGEIYILAVDPDHQRRGLGSALMDHGCEQLRQAGLNMVMVETGGDPGHAPSRATYESFGFERWPVARYFKEL